jgi:segregation and condensation protein A
MLDTLEALSIDVAAEFLVLASELAHIKSKMLLPAREGVAVESEAEPELDPREELVRRLLEYQKYRDAAGQLADRDQLGRDVFARVPSTIDVVGDLDAGLEGVSVFKLVELMAGLIKRDEGHHQISFEAISISERIDYVFSFGQAREGRFSLTELLQGIATRRELVVTFIAVLEMTRLKMLRLFAEDAEEERRRAEAASPSSDPLDDALGSEAGARDARASARADDPPLPLIWVELTGKMLDGQIRDDYR